MTASVLIKYGLVLAILAGLVWAVHDNGRTVESAECRKRENAELADKNRDLETAHDQLAAATKRNAALAALNLKLNDEVTTNANRANETVAANDARLRRDPVGLRLPRETCAAAATMSVPAPGGGAALDNGGGRDDRPRLPSGIETGLFDLTLRANKTRVKRDECREFAIGVAARRTAWEAEQTREENGLD